MSTFPLPASPHANPLTLAACWAGKWPAEMLARGERDLLLFELWRAGRTDLEISQHMKETLYTTCRIRNRLGLEARSPTEEAA
jgi:hypothetical protein